MPLPVLGLGSNSANKLEMMQRARILLHVFLGPIVKASSIYRTDPWGITEQDTFLNQVVQVNTEASIDEVIDQIDYTEQMLGKQKSKEKYGPRNIDIDLLFFDDIIYNQDEYRIPHPRLHLRNFVLTPLTEILPDLVHPEFKKSVSELSHQCPDSAAVERIKEPVS